MFLGIHKMFLSGSSTSYAGLIQVANYHVHIMSTWLYGIFGFIIMAIALV
jgi:hypothetical protein